MVYHNTAKVVICRAEDCTIRITQLELFQNLEGKEHVTAGGPLEGYIQEKLTIPDHWIYWEYIEISRRYMYIQYMGMNGNLIIT